jgi:capsular polysaccharide biosynthesis protein
VALWASATLPDAPVSPRALRNGLIALVAALTVSAGLLVGRRALGR